MKFVIIAEAEADAQIARDLADRVVYANTDRWLDHDTIDFMRKWRGLDGGAAYTKWTDVKTLAKTRSIKPLGHRSTGTPGGIDYAQSRKAILLHERRFRDDNENLPVLLLMRDMDRQPERARGIRQAREEPPEMPFVVIIGAANPKREAWVLNGFDPQTGEEQKRLDELKQDLERDPRTHAHTLTASQTGAKNNAKRVLDVLVTGRDQEVKC